MMTPLAIALAFAGRFSKESGPPPVITAVTAPSLATLTDGDTLSAAVTWGTGYASSESTITGTVREMSVNNGAFVAYDGTGTVSATDIYRLRETVSDGAGNIRAFLTVPKSVDALNTVTVAITGSAGEIVFDPIASLDGWIATTGNAGEIIMEAA